MNRFRRSLLAAICVAFLSANFSFAQSAPAAQTANHPHESHPAPINIKALPKDITGEDLHKLMHQYESDLGVECGFCHARNPDTKRIDFASDANPLKDTARMMIRMTDDLNTKYLTQLGADHKSDDPITCGTCHRGMAHPAAFAPKPSDHDHPHDH